MCVPVGAAVPHTANVVAFLVFLFVVCGIIGRHLPRDNAWFMTQADAQRVIID